MAHMRYMNTAVEAATQVGQGRSGRRRPDDRRQDLPGRARAHAGGDRGGLATPGPMGRIKGADVAIASPSSSSTWSARRRSCPTAPTAPSPTARSRLAHRAVQVTATYGGTTEVFRTIIAQHHLGLPRPDYPGRKVFLQGGRPAAA